MKQRIKDLGLTQQKVILELHKYGITVQPAEFSMMLSGTLTSPKAKRTLEAVNKILNEYEDKQRTIN